MAIDAVTIHDGRTDATPEQLGLDAKRLQRLDSHFAKLIGEGKLQGASYLIARDGRIALHRSMGKLSSKDDSPDLMPDSIRKIYSTTKVVTATAAMQLVEEGKIYLQQPVAHWIPEFDTDLHRGITIWHLLTHTSGIYGDGGQNFEPYSLPGAGWRVREKQRRTGSSEEGEWIQYVLSGPMRSKPGEEWTYTSAGLELTAEIVARASGMPFDRYVSERILDPLGMERSGFRVPEHLRQETCFTNDWEAGDIFNPQEDRTGFPPGGGGGMFSTLEDMWKFGQAMLNGGTFRGARIVGRKTVSLMTANHLHGVRTRSWGLDNVLHKHGLGFALHRDDLCTPGTYGHEGWGRCGLYLDPAERLTFMYFVPSRHDFVPEALIHPRAIVWSSIL